MELAYLRNTWRGMPENRKDSREKAMKKILLVDDEPTILLTLSHILRSHGIEVVNCDHVGAAFSALNGTHYDMALVDIRLSGVEGREGLDLIRTIKTHSPTTVVVAMTAYGTEELRREALARGASFYYNKPISLEQILALIDIPAATS